MNNRCQSSGACKSYSLLFIVLITGSSLFAQDLQTPLQKSGYSRVTSYDELSAYLKQLDTGSELLTVEIAGKSVQGRNPYAMKFSSSGFGKDPSKIRVLIFAQQHGNEPAGKEGALLLVAELLKPANRYLFDRIDLLIVSPDESRRSRSQQAAEWEWG